MLIYSNTFATNQFPERIIIFGDTFALEQFPLEEGLNVLAKRMALEGAVCLSSACWRGYQGVWQIENDSLFLIDLKPCCELAEDEINPLQIDSLFKNLSRNGIVFANWVTDTLQVSCISQNCDDYGHVIFRNGLLRQIQIGSAGSESNLITEVTIYQQKEAKDPLTAWYMPYAVIVLLILLIVVGYILYRNANRKEFTEEDEL